MPVTRSSLKHEAEVLHRQFFRCNAPDRLIENYIRVHEEQPELLMDCSKESRTVKIIVEKNLDALGIEICLRTGSKRHLLSRKLLLLAYLAECDGLHPKFRQVAKGRVHSLMQLCASIISAAFHWFKGKCQMAIYGLV